MAQIPEVVALRLPLYARTLAHIGALGQDLVSSQELGKYVRATPAQIRKDLSYFGRFGRQGRGYNVKYLLEELRRILGLHQQWAMALVGVGNLGQAILHYQGFAPEGFIVVAAFDADVSKIGCEINEITVQAMNELGETVRRHGISIGIIAVPPRGAQEVADMMVENGIQAILNYAPMALRVPPQVQVRDIDPLAALQSMTFYIKEAGANPSTSAAQAYQ